MIIYPDIELRKGRCVNLRRGRMDDPVVYDVDPVEAACNFARQGAEWLHVVDLDAVFNDGDNAEIIQRIIDEAGCSVQVGGAIRSMNRVHDWMNAGAARVVIATAAVKHPHFEASKMHTKTNMRSALPPTQLSVRFTRECQTVRILKNLIVAVR